MLSSSYDLWQALRELGYLREDLPEYWWDGVGEFRVVVGSILTQQAKWESVEKSLDNLQMHDLLSLKKIAMCDLTQLANLIKPSGFYNKKAKVLKDLSQNILDEFGDFESFKEGVSREWLLEQRGIGFESADSILCYGCKRDVMVVDAYTNRLLREFGYEFESYDELQEWIVRGIESNMDKISLAYKCEVNCFTIYSRFHGKIVEYCKDNSLKNRVLIDRLMEVL